MYEYSICLLSFYLSFGFCFERQHTYWIHRQGSGNGNKESVIHVFKYFWVLNMWQHMKFFRDLKNIV